MPGTTPVRTLTWPQVWAHRLARHYLLQPAPVDEMAAVVGAVCGIQAQVMPAAELAIGVRLAGATRRDVQAALWEQRRLVKTFGIRGTIHLFPADELPLWMAALRPREEGEDKRLAQQGLDRTQLDVLVAAIGESLDGRRLTTRALGEEVVRRAGPWAGETVGAAWVGGWPRWRFALGAAAVAGVLLYGPPEGAEVTFVRPDQWLGSWREMEPPVALAEVFRRYLRAYGPATPRDFAQWFSLAPRVARALAADLRDELEEVDVEGQRAFLLAPDAAAVPVAEPAAVRLLPHFDCYVIGCHPRARLLPSAWAGRVPARTTPSQFPVLLVDGVIAGLWERQGKGRHVTIRVESLIDLSTTQREQLEAEAGRVGEILGAEATLAFGPVAARPHL